MILYMEKTKDPTKKLLGLINKFSKLADTKSTLKKIHTFSTHQ
jgi:hypothetical protein